MSLVLAEYAIESALVVLIACVATTVLRTSTAALRASVWKATFAIVLCLAPLTAVRPRLGVPVPAPVPVMVETAGRSSSPLAAPASNLDELVPALASGNARSGARSGAGTFPWTAAALAIWALGSLVGMARLTLGWIRLVRLRRRSVPVTDPRILALAHSVRRAMGTRSQGSAMTLPASAVL